MSVELSPTLTILCTDRRRSYPRIAYRRRSWDLFFASYIYLLFSRIADMKMRQRERVCNKNNWKETLLSPLIYVVEDTHVGTERGYSI